MANITTNSSLSVEMKTWYDKMFLKRVTEVTVLDQFGQKRNVPQNEGKVVQFMRYSSLATATTALTEATNPAGSNLSATAVSATLAEYGDFTSIGGLLALTAIDPGLSEKYSILASQAGETIEELVRGQIASGGTAQTVSTASGGYVASILATDVLASKDIRKAVRTLKVNKAMAFPGGSFVCVVSPYTEYDFLADSTWVAAKTYSDVLDLYKGELGTWFGVRFVMATTPYRTDPGESGGTLQAYSATGTVSWTPVFGMQAYGLIDLAGDQLRTFLKTPGPSDTSNPLDMFSTCGWKLGFATKVLNSNFIINIKSGHTA